MSMKQVYTWEGLAITATNGGWTVTDKKTGEIFGVTICEMYREKYLFKVADMNQMETFWVSTDDGVLSIKLREHSRRCASEWIAKSIIDFELDEK